jgi:hypothetical protein
MIGVSDGNQYQSEFEAELGPINIDKPMAGSKTPSTMPSTATEKPAGEFKVDRGYNVPLIAAKTPTGIAIDHRVSTDMEFEGKTHDITPFLIAHENAEIGPMEDLIKGGMDAKSAYELAHDKAANPAEASARFAYAAKNNLDPEEFNNAYYAHIAEQAKIASEPSDRPRHPDAHTTRYGLDPVRIAMAPRDDDTGKPMIEGVPKTGEGGGGRPTTELSEQTKKYMSVRDMPAGKLRPAIRTDKGTYVGAAIHDDAREEMQKTEGPDKWNYERGYVNSEGKFLTEYEARQPKSDK